MASWGEAGTMRAMPGKFPAMPWSNCPFPCHKNQPLAAQLQEICNLVPCNLHPGEGLTSILPTFHLGALQPVEGVLSINRSLNQSHSERSSRSAQGENAFYVLTDYTLSSHRSLSTTAMLRNAQHLRNTGWMGTSIARHWSAASSRENRDSSQCNDTEGKRRA